MSILFSERFEKLVRVGVRLLCYLFLTCARGFSYRYRPRFFEPEPEDVTQWDGRPVLSEAGKAALERDFKADYPVYP